LQTGPADGPIEETSLADGSRRGHENRCRRAPSGTDKVQQSSNVSSDEQGVIIVQVVIRSRNIEVTEHLREVTNEKIGRLVKYLEGMETAEVRFFEEKNPRIAKHEVCEVTLHGHGHHVRAKATAIDAIAAIDLVVDKLKHLLTKLKDKLVTKHHQRHHHPKGWDVTNKGGVALLEPDPAAIAPPRAEEPDPDEARIVKTKQHKVEPMTARLLPLHER
jgi:putative sigma-54 modulation protein